MEEDDGEFDCNVSGIMGSSSTAKPTGSASNYNNLSSPKTSPIKVISPGKILQS